MQFFMNHPVKADTASNLTIVSAVAKPGFSGGGRRDQKGGLRGPQSPAAILAITTSLKNSFLGAPRGGGVGGGGGGGGGVGGGVGVVVVVMVVMVVMMMIHVEMDIQT
jgi:hypothetical protein